MKKSVFLFVAMFFVSLTFAQELTEIRANQPGIDNDEYFELSGTASFSLDGLTFLVIGDDDQGGFGNIDNVTSLAGQSIPANGVFLCAESTYSLSGTADYVADMNMEGGDNLTFFLVEGFSGSLDQDLDTDDDGTLDITPWTTIVSEVAVVGDPYPGEQGWAYSEVTVGPDGEFQPGHIYLTDAGWQVGKFDPSESTNENPGELNSDYTNSIQYLEAQNISIYPNPCSDFITISAENIINISIHSITGQEIISTTENKIDIRKFATGVYFVTISTKNVKISTKIVKN